MENGVKAPDIRNFFAV